MRVQRFDPDALRAMPILVPPPPATLASWMLLSFIAGCINVGGFIACGRFVTHLTGFPTLFGLDAANGRFDMAIGILSVPLFFLAGVCLSAIQIDRRIQQGKLPRYALVFSLIALCLILVAIGGSYDFFGSFGTPVRLKHDYFFLALLCMASGLQNAAITSASGATMRVTHLTGMVTDLGIGITRGWRQSHPLTPREIRANWIRGGALLSFTAGSLIGAIIFLHHHYWGFLFPALLVLPAAAGTLAGMKEKN